MNEQWSSSAGVCVQPQSSEQRPLAVGQQARASISIPEGSTTASTVASPPFTVYTRPLHPSSFCGSSSTGVVAQHAHTSRPQSLLANGVPPNCTLSAPKKEEPGRGSCSRSATSSLSLKQEETPFSAAALLANVTPSTSSGGSFVTHESASSSNGAPQDASPSRPIRRRCNFVLPAYETCRLRRIAETQPITLRRLGVSSIKVGDDELIPVIVNSATLRLPATSRAPIPATPSPSETPTTSTARVPPPHDSQSADSELAEQHETNSDRDFRHETVPSTSKYGPPPSKRKPSDFDSSQPPQTPSGAASRFTSHDSCATSQPTASGITSASASSVTSGSMSTYPTPPVGAHGHPVPPGASAVRQTPPSAVNNNSPLLVNLLRSASPGAGASMNAPSVQSHPQRPPATPGAPQMSTPPLQSQSSAGFSPYPSYMPRTPLASTPGGPPSVQMRPPPTPGEVNQQLTPTSSHSHSDQQPQVQQQMNVERQRHMMGTQQGSQPQQIPQQGYYPPPQYNQQHRPVPPQGYVVAGGGHGQQQQSVVYQQSQPTRPQYMSMQQQSGPPGHSLPPQYHHTVPMEQEVASAAPAQTQQPTKKRKRPSKKQLKEQEMAQQAAAAAAAQQQHQQQQQQYLMEQQMNTRVPPTNAHTVERPAMLPQVIQGGQHQPGIVYAQQSRGYPAGSMQSPSNSAPPPGPHLQSPSSNTVYYHQQQQQPQQQHMWPPQQQSQMIHPQRSSQMMQPQQQIVYGGQMQQQWQSGQNIPQRVAYPQADNVSEISATSSGSVHTSPMASRNASIDFSPASQSSSTMSPLYHQQQPHMVYQQQQQSGQTPPSGATYPQPATSQAMPQGNQQRTDQQMQQTSQMQVQQQHHAYMQSHQKMDGNSEFGMQDDLGANIADDCGDFNDLDSIEPMTESGEVGATLLASHQQHAQQPGGQQQQQVHLQMNHQAQQQGCYGMSSQVHRPGQGYDTVMQMPVSSQAECQRLQHPPGGYMQQPAGVQSQGVYAVQHKQQQQQQTQHSGAYALQQPSTSQSGYVQAQRLQSPSPQTSGGYSQHLGQQGTTMPPTPTSGYMMSPMPQHQPVGTSINPTMTHPPQQQLLHSGPHSDDAHLARPEDGVGPNISRSDNSKSKERDKDPINSTIGKYSAGNGNTSGIKAPPVVRQSSVPVARPGVYHHHQQAMTYEMTAGSSGSPRPLNGQPTSATSVPGRPSTLVKQLSAPMHTDRRAPPSSAGTSESGEDAEMGLLANGQKDRKLSDSAMVASEQRGNSASYVAQHHLSNGHDLHLMKEFRYVQQPNGISAAMLSEEERRALAAQHSITVQRTPPKTAAPRRNRRKADLSQEASPQGDDEEDFFMSASATSQAPRVSYTRRVSIAGGVVVGSSGSAASQQSFSGVVSVQSAQNNFSATMARQQQQIMKQQPKTT